MKRREFLRALSAGLAAAPVAAVMHPPVHEGWGPADVGMGGEGEKRVTKNWIWLGPDPDVSDDEYSRRFERLKRAGIDAILPEIFNNRQAFWGSEHLPVVAPVLERLIPLAHATNIEVHAWSHIMTCNVPDVMETHPEWYDVNRKGESARDKPAYVDYYRFMCPSRPGVQQFLQQRMRELAAIDGLDGIHLDYIRFPDVILAEALQPKYDLVQDSEFPEYDYCYCDVCRAGFKAAHGLDPLVDLKDPPANEAWFQYRCDLISRLVNEDLIPIGRAAGKQMTAAVFPNWRHVRQEWHKWELDAVLPMLYNGFYNEELAWVGEQCSQGIARMKDVGVSKDLYSGLFLGDVPAQKLNEAIDTSLKGGARGVSLFAFGGLTDGHVEVMQQRFG